MWYHYQMAVKRALRGNGQRVVNPHIALNADGDDVDEHAAQLREQWNMLREQVPTSLLLSPALLPASYLAISSTSVSISSGSHL